MTPCPTPRKERFTSQADAVVLIKELTAAKTENKKVLNTLGAYKCPCGYFHVGHNKYKRVRQ